MNTIPLIVLAALLAATADAAAADPARVVSFSPQGLAPGAAQVLARFDQPMVAFGDPRAPAPFDIDCPMPGSGRWEDTRNWVYGFNEPLPAGIACRFAVNADLRGLDGAPVADAVFEFNTGGPRVVHVLPWEGDSAIDENQVFLLGLDTPVAAAQIEGKAFCEVAGVAEKVGVEVLDAAVRDELLAARDDFMEVYENTLTGYGERRVGMVLSGRVLAGDDAGRMAAIAAHRPSPVVALRCRRGLPPEADVALVWDPGIRAQGGSVNESRQLFAWRTREAFRAGFHCRRDNADADCNPVLPMRLRFTAPISREQAARIALAPESGEPIAPELDDEHGEWVDGVGFPGPFPENASYTLILPDGLTDDAGRPLDNAARFPLAVRTDEYAPLIQFPAGFGIIEYTADAALPVTLRNLEAVVAPDGDGGVEEPPWYRRWYRDFRERYWPKAARVHGRTMRIDDPTAAYAWMARVRESRRARGHYDRDQSAWVVDSRPGERSLFEGIDAVSSFTVSKPGGGRPMEVIGIPFAKPGFYLVEIASRRLGAALYGQALPYHAQTAVLVTNLAVHFKHGRESSLIWVTRLDSGLPAGDVAVTIADCGGDRLFAAHTDADGIARVPDPLPALPAGCDDYIVSARHGGDMTFTLSGWTDGIEPWRFNLPYAGWDTPNLAAAVFDRPLYRTGETVHMKLFARRHGEQGLSLVETGVLPEAVEVVHEGSGERYEVATVFDRRASAAATWTIPGHARAGRYLVRIDLVDAARGALTLTAGAFRVEQFRVPTMNAVVAPVAVDLVRAVQAEVDIQLNYLSGGGAGHAAVRLRTMVRERPVRFDRYEEFSIANGDVVEGRQSGDGGAVGAIIDDRSVVLDESGGARVRLAAPDVGDRPRQLEVEVEYADANGEILTRAARMTVWPASVVVGIRPEGWAATRDKLAFKAVALDLEGRPLAGRRITVDALARTVYSHRKRLVGGFYSYESVTEVSRLATLCEGETDDLGLLHCESAAPADGNLILRATIADDDGNKAFAHRDVWVAGAGDWWFEVGDEDRMDVLAENDELMPGDRARLQVRMPFREASALVTVEREGVLDAFVTRLDGARPVVEVPIAAHYAPNVFVSVLAVRGRSGEPPGVRTDLGKPAFRLGVAELRVGHAAHRLGVAVTADRDVYQARERARVRIHVSAPAGGRLPDDAEVAVAAVDEGLLELLPNTSWDLLAAMMGRRAIEVETASAQMQVVGKRHFGSKAVAAGGGGGRQSTRELFDTLLYWNARVGLDGNGEAEVEVPLNDSLTSFRIVAVASAGAGLFGTGDASIRVTREIMVIPGLPAVVREGDRLRVVATVRNSAAGGGARAIEVTASARGNAGAASLPVREPRLGPGEAAEVGWDVEVASAAAALELEIEARVDGVVGDRVAVAARVLPAVPVAVLQATLARLDGAMALPASAPAGALPGRGGLRISLSPTLAAQLDGVADYMRTYPYSCLEQRVSRAVVLDDAPMRDALLDELPGYLDGDGLARFWPSLARGDDILTSYLLAVADSAGWKLPDAARERMLDALAAFLDGRLPRFDAGRGADLPLRRLAAMEALSRYRALVPGWLTATEIEPARWPTSALIDWILVLRRGDDIEGGDRRLGEALSLLRSRMHFRGTALTFSDEAGDALSWLMVSADVNANRAILALLDHPGFAEDIPRMVRGSLARRVRGRWPTTPANAWGVLAVRAFAERFEREPVSGTTELSYGGDREFSWRQTPAGGSMTLPWQSPPENLELRHGGGGRPWVSAQSLAAVPLASAVSSGYRIRRRVEAVVQSHPGRWTRGDVARVTLRIDAGADMSWVVVDDPVPAGASVLGGGFRTDSAMLASASGAASLSPAFEERAADAYRAYYAFVPAGPFTVAYTVRFNSAGTFTLPPTRVEAMYMPEMHAASPNEAVTIAEESR